MAADTPLSSDPARTDLGRFDYIVVGAGTAGCVLANRLSADPGTRVLLLEAGGSDDYVWIRVPVGYLYTQMNPRTDWCFRTEPQAGLNRRALNYPRGKVLGGCSSINGMLYLRGQARDYDQWRQMGNPGWGWDDVLPYFKRSEDFAHGADDMHGAGGEIRVEEQRLSWPILDAFRDAFAEIGIMPIADFNRGDNAGCGYFQVTQRRGRRWSAADGFLHPIRARPNLTVLTHAHAERLRFAGRRVVGLDFAHRGRPISAAAEGEVLLAAGAVGSPQLLQLSGIGPPALLSALGIPVRAAMDGVGANLQDHLQIRLVFKVANTVTLNRRANSLAGKLGMAWEYVRHRRGPLSMAPSQFGAFARSDPARETPDLEYHVQPLSLDRFGEPLHKFDAVTASVCHLRPESRGTVRIRSADPAEPPAIDPNYFSAPADRRTAIAAVRLTRRLMSARALAPFAPVEHPPLGRDDDQDHAVMTKAESAAATIFHPVGTCKMGDDAMAVVDARLRLRGFSGLRVVDASIMPTITSGNTNAPVTMIAEKAADMIREDSRPQAAKR